MLRQTGYRVSWRGKGLREPERWYWSSCLSSWISIRIFCIPVYYRRRSLSSSGNWICSILSGLDFLWLSILSYLLQIALLMLYSNESGVLVRFGQLCASLDKFFPPPSSGKEGFSLMKKYYTKSSFWLLLAKLIHPFIKFIVFGIFVSCTQFYYYTKIGMRQR